MNAVSKPQGRRNKSQPNNKAPDAQPDVYFRPYSDYARTLRTWLVAYGIGGPVLFLTNEKIWEALKASGEMPLIGILFFIGVVAQVVAAFLNKFAMWVLYHGETDETVIIHRHYKLANWFSRKILFDVAVDSVTIGVFAVATWKAFGLLTT